MARSSGLRMRFSTSSIFLVFRTTMHSLSCAALSILLLKVPH
jgi:hypothetical protein